MRFRNEIAPTIGGSYGATTNSKCLGGQRNIATLGTAACYCGGPGGRPGMAPICLSCYSAHRLITRVKARRAAWGAS